MHSELAMLTAWGRTSRAPCVTLRPTDTTDTHSIFTDPRPRAHGLIAHAAGRAYGDCALNDQGSVLLTASLNRVLSFNPATAIATLEPGVTFRQLMAEFLPRGFLAPVSPGTGFATIGGAIANDVHGKNHESAGSLAQHVTELDLLTANGQPRTITPASDPALFRATCGGLGLTGIILRIALKLAPVPGPAMAVTSQRLPDLDHFLAAIDQAAGTTYTVGWIDGTARGRHLGRGILEQAEFVAGPAPKLSPNTLRIPFDFPNFALNPISIQAFNELYYRHAPATPRTRSLHVGKFFYPLDALRDWNRIYGKRGFYQFQNILPFATGPTALRELMELIASSGRASFLTTLKRLGPGIGPSGHLSFPQPGYTLALDFPAGPGIADLYAQLCAITVKHGGRVYLAKDALLSRDHFRAMYPQWPAFRDIVAQHDPQKRLQSAMSRRLGLHPA